MNKLNKQKYITLSILLLIIVGLILWIFVRSPKHDLLHDEVDHEVGEDFNLENLIKNRREVASFDLLTDLEEIDFEDVGSHTLRLELKTTEGKKVRESVQLNLVDTTMPQVVVKSVQVGKNSEIIADMFIEEAIDNTELVHKIVSDIDKSVNEQDVEIETKDRGDNTVTNTARLIFSDFLGEVTMELGSQENLKPEDILVEGSKSKIEIVTSEEKLRSLTFGKHEIDILYNGERTSIILNLIDTKAPVAKAAEDLILYIGYPFEYTSLLESYEDESKVTISTKERLVVDKEGKYKTVVVLTDEGENTSEVEVEYEVKADTEAPEIHGASDIEIGIGQNPRNFLGIAIQDNVDLRPSAEIDDSEVDTTKAGEYPLTIKAYDKMNNVSEKTIMVRVLESGSNSNLASRGRVINTRPGQDGDRQTDRVINTRPAANRESLIAAISELEQYITQNQSSYTEASLSLVRSELLEVKRAMYNNQVSQAKLDELTRATNAMKNNLVSKETQGEVPVETQEETVEETQIETIEETVEETVQETVEETPQETIEETIEETEVETETSSESSNETND